MGRHQRNGTRNHNAAMRGIMNSVCAYLVRRDNKQSFTPEPSIKVWRSSFKLVNINKVRRAHVGIRSETNKHVPRNGQWCGTYPGYPKDHGLYDQSKEEAGQCQAILHQGRTSYKGGAPSVSYTFEDGRKRKRRRASKSVPVPKLAKAIAKRDSLQVTHRRKRMATLG